VAVDVVAAGFCSARVEADVEEDDGAAFFACFLAAFLLVVFSLEVDVAPDRSTSKNSSVSLETTFSFMLLLTASANVGTEGVVVVVVAVFCGATSFVVVDSTMPSSPVSLLLRESPEARAAPLPVLGPLRTKVVPVVVVAVFTLSFGVAVAADDDDGVLFFDFFAMSFFLTSFH